MKSTTKSRTQNLGLNFIERFFYWLAPVNQILGMLLILLAAFMLVPMIFSIYFSGSEQLSFSASFGITLSVGVGLVLFSRSVTSYIKNKCIRFSDIIAKENSLGNIIIDAGIRNTCNKIKENKFSLNGKQIFITTTLSWVVMSAFSILPFVLGSAHLDLASAWFEAASGITSTGATVMSGLDQTPRGILLWRGILQWIGGIGIIVMGMAILPFLRVGGMRLFRTESSDKLDKALPRSSTVAKAIGKVYVGITIACILMYKLAGMNWFDAITHALTTCSTGGLANYDSSFAHFDSYPIYWVGIFFMILSALPFVLYVQAITGRWSDVLVIRWSTLFKKSNNKFFSIDRSLLTKNRWKKLFKLNLGVVFNNTQVKAFFMILLFAIFLLSSYLIFKLDFNWFDAITHASFNIVSIATTTGFSSTDYAAWGNFSIMLFLYLTFVGGCSGSTTGGFKVFRLQIAVMLMKNQMKSLLHPRGVFAHTYGGKPVPNDVIRSVVTFAFYFFASICALALALSFMDLDFLTAFTAAATSISNVGPGLGNVVGPSGNFSTLPDAAKFLLGLGMILGRLEIVTFMILFTKSFWRT